LVLPGYNSTIQPIAEVPVYSALDTLSLQAAPVGSSVKVTANAQGKFEIYLRTDLGWERVGLQDGTIQFLKNYGITVLAILDLMLKFLMLNILIKNL
jgi:hypothetical protein